ncbi:unnamed protein product [Hymenolepis diminuta]|uniref:Uncharacterized protein n=1 Tax=Hymenolepis diminuta TaxID=6216 RepID=A0A564Z8L9_HYMDI|nr:unnamed protein product [Hymenolepis diminuta]
MTSICHVPTRPSISLSSFHLKSTSALVFSLVLYSSNSYKAIFVFHSRVLVTSSYASGLSPLFLSTLPSLSLIHSFQTHCGFLEYISGLINSRRSASQLLLALTQKAKNWRLLLLLLFVSCKTLVIF